jgi:hypothetical protein
LDSFSAIFYFLIVVLVVISSSGCFFCIFICALSKCKAMADDVDFGAAHHDAFLTEGFEGTDAKQRRMLEVPHIEETICDLDSFSAILYFLSGCYFLCLFAP